MRRLRLNIIDSISQNQKAGNITPDDARRLRQLTHRLYRHLYAGYREMEVLDEMTDESLLLDADIWENEREELKEQYEKKLADKDRELAELKRQLAQLQSR